MNYREIAAWVRSHHEMGLDLLRIYLGAALAVRGGLLLVYGDTLTQQLAPDFNLGAFDQAAVTYAAIAHVVGGVLLAVGLLTRLSALIQIPVLIAAVFFVHLREGLLSPGQSLEVAALVLFFLVLFFAFGSGPLSVDRWLKRQTSGA